MIELTVKKDEFWQEDGYDEPLYEPYFEYEAEGGYFCFSAIDFASWHTTFLLPIDRGDSLVIIRDDQPLNKRRLVISLSGREASQANIVEIQEDGSWCGHNDNPNITTTPEISALFAYANNSHYLDAKLLKDGDCVIIKPFKDIPEIIEEKRERFLQTLKRETRLNKPMKKSPCVFVFN